MESPSNIQVGEIVARPGEKACGYLRVATAATTVELPITIACGRRPGPRLALVAGVHGSEYVGIAAAVSVMRDLDPDALAGAVLSVNIVNVPAFRERIAYICPLDGANFGRAFPGQAQGTPSEIIADRIQREVVARCAHVIELHGGDITEDLVPFLLLHRTGNEEVDRRSLALAGCYGIPYVVQSPSWDGRYDTHGACYAVACEAGKPSLLAEAGQHGQVDAGAVQTHVDGVTNVLRYLGMIQGIPQEVGEPRVTRRYVSLRSPASGLLRPRVLAGDTVAEGDVVAVIDDYFGSLIAEVRAPIGGIVLYRVSSLTILGGEGLLGIGDFS
jgi:predicted deacylase